MTILYIRLSNHVLKLIFGHFFYCVYCLCMCIQGRSQDFRKEGAIVSSDCAHARKASDHAHPLNHVGLVIYARGALSLEVSEEFVRSALL